MKPLPDGSFHRRALITGITGQDGSYLAEFLLQRGYQVFGLVRRSSSPNWWRIRHLLDRVELIDGDLTDLGSLCRALRQARPAEVYNLASQSFVPTSWSSPLLTSEVTGLGAARVLEAVRLECPTSRVFQASSSEMFGCPEQSPQNEETPLRPRSPYGVAKVFAHQMVSSYRDSFSIFAVSGISFNHESPRRGLRFVTRKIARAAAAVSMGLLDEVPVGNLEARRDWGHARDYVAGMWAMLQQPEPRDFVLATGVSHTVRELVEVAFGRVGVEPWRHVHQDPAFFRPAEVHALVGDASRAREQLGWAPRVGFGELIEEMVDAEVRRLTALRDAGSDCGDPLHIEVPEGLLPTPQ